MRKFICLGYWDESAWGRISKAEQEALMEQCFAYDDELRRGGHFAGGEALQSHRNAVTLRVRGGEVAVTDGPYAETKEQIGGILILEARDLNHAIQLMSKHPGVRVGPFEIRPADEEMNALISARAQSAQRRKLAECKMPAEPQGEHHWLTRLAGEWTYEHECMMGPDKPPAKFAGRETVRSLGGLWIVAEGEGETPCGGTGRTLMTLGYDPRRSRFVGTFVASMMDHVWAYEGSLDSSGRKLVLDTQGPNFTQDGLTSYRDTLEVVDDSHRILTSQALMGDGKWVQFMTAQYYRAK